MESFTVGSTGLSDSTPRRNPDLKGPPSSEAALGLAISSFIYGTRLGESHGDLDKSCDLALEALIRHRVCCCFDVRLLSFQNCKQFLLFMSTEFMIFCYRNGIDQDDKEGQNKKKIVT